MPAYNGIPPISQRIEQSNPFRKWIVLPRLTRSSALKSVGGLLPDINFASRLYSARNVGNAPVQSANFIRFDDATKIPSESLRDQCWSFHSTLHPDRAQSRFRSGVVAAGPPGSVLTLYSKCPTVAGTPPVSTLMTRPFFIAERQPALRQGRGAFRANSSRRQPRIAPTSALSSAGSSRGRPPSAITLGRETAWFRMSAQHTFSIRRCGAMLCARFSILGRVLGSRAAALQTAATISAPHSNGQNPLGQRTQLASRSSWWGWVGDVVRPRRPSQPGCAGRPGSGLLSRQALLPSAHRQFQIPGGFSDRVLPAPRLLRVKSHMFSAKSETSHLFAHPVTPPRCLRSARLLRTHSRKWGRRRRPYWTCSALSGPCDHW